MLLPTQWWPSHRTQNITWTWEREHVYTTEVLQTWHAHLIRQTALGWDVRYRAWKETNKLNLSLQRYAGSAYFVKTKPGSAALIELACLSIIITAPLPLARGRATCSRQSLKWYGTTPTHHIKCAAIVMLAAVQLRLELCVAAAE